MTFEKRDRQADVRSQFSPFKSCTRTLPGHVSRVGVAWPTPLPERVGAMHATCSGPLSRKYRPFGDAPMMTPSSPNNPACAYSSEVAQRAEPWVVATRALRDRHTAYAISAATPTRGPIAQM